MDAKMSNAHLLHHCNVVLSSMSKTKEKSLNFIRTKGRHFDNLMTWLVRLGSIK